MNLTITNTGANAETVAGIDSPSVTLGGTGRTGLAGNRGSVAWTQILEPGVPFESNSEQSIVIIGDKPSVREQIEQGLATAGAALRELYDAIRERRKPQISGEPLPKISVTLTNHGENAIRVILGDGVTDVQVAPGTTSELEAPGYLELRELGLVQQPHNAGTPD